MMRTPAPIKAQDKYEEKRKQYRLPGIYLSEEQFKIFNKAMGKFGGSKKA
jgi:hypothetical protein